MYTRCPHCSTSFRITNEQLRARAGKVRCGQCQQIFNAFDSLSQNELPNVSAAASKATPAHAHTPQTPLFGNAAKTGATVAAAKAGQSQHSQQSPQSQPLPADLDVAFRWPDEAQKKTTAPTAPTRTAATTAATATTPNPNSTPNTIPTPQPVAQAAPTAPPRVVPDFINKHPHEAVNVGTTRANKPTKATTTVEELPEDKTTAFFDDKQHHGSADDHQQQQTTANATPASPADKGCSDSDDNNNGNDGIGDTAGIEGVVGGGVDKVVQKQQQHNNQVGDEEDFDYAGSETLLFSPQEELTDDTLDFNDNVPDQQGRIEPHLSFLPLAENDRTDSRAQDNDATNADGDDSFGAGSPECATTVDLPPTPVHEGQIWADEHDEARNDDSIDHQIQGDVNGKTGPEVLAQRPDDNAQDTDANDAEARDDLYAANIDSADHAELTFNNSIGGEQADNRANGHEEILAAAREQEAVADRDNESDVASDVALGLPPPPWEDEDNNTGANKWPTLLSCILLLVLLGQGFIYYRGALSEQWPILRTVYDALSLQVPLPRHLDQLTIEASDLNSEEEKDLYLLQATLGNRAQFDQAWPNLDITFTDTFDRALLHRSLTPKDYLPDNVHSPSFLAHSETAVRLWLSTQGVDAAGYRLSLTYPPQ